MAVEYGIPQFFVTFTGACPSIIVAHRHYKSIHITPSLPPILPPSPLFALPLVALLFFSLSFLSFYLSS